MGGQRHPDGVETVPVTPEQLTAFDRAREMLAQSVAPILVREDSGTDRMFLAAFDGTGNSMKKDAPANHTNVALIYQQVLHRNRDGVGHIRAGYVEGVGTQGGLSGLRDLASGRTYQARLEDMYLQVIVQAKNWMDANPQADIRVCAIGFSRGAEQAVGFTRMVEGRGIQDPDGARVSRDRDGMIQRIEFTAPPLREPGSVVQAIGLFDPVGTGVPRQHDRRPPPSVVSGLQLTALHVRRNLFQGTQVADPGITMDGRFTNLALPGAHSDVGGGYLQHGLSVRSGNLMIDYLNALSDRPFLAKRPEPDDPALNVIHRSEQHQVFYRTSRYDGRGGRVHQEELAPPPLCAIDCRDAEPRNEAMAAALEWRRVPIGPVPGAPAQAAATTVGPERLPGLDRLLAAALRDDAAAVRRFSLDLLDGPAGQAWLAEGEAGLRGRGWLQEDATQRMPAVLEPQR